MLKHVLPVLAALCVGAALAGSASAATPTACSLLTAADYKAVIGKTVKITSGEGTASCNEANLTLCPDCLEFVCECPKDRWTRATSSSYAKPSAGRGPTGRMRNFKAMSDEKLLDVKQQLFLDGNDPLAVWRVNEELKRRGLPVT